MIAPESFQALSVPERLELIGEIWDSIPDSFDQTAIPDWHRAELERRLIAADAAPDASVPWEEAKARLEKRP